MTITKQVRDCRIGDILLYKNEESRMITNIAFSAYKTRPYLIRTTDLAGENHRFDTYDASDEINVWGTQEALF